MEFVKAINLGEKEKYVEEIAGGWGAKVKTLRGGGMGIFWNHSHKWLPCPKKSATIHSSKSSHCFNH